jgi:hypothetical protein
MKFKDYIRENLLLEKKITIGGKEFNSAKEAGLYLGSIGKTAKEIMKLLGTTEPMAAYYARAGAKTKGSTPKVASLPVVTKTTGSIAGTKTIAPGAQLGKKTFKSVKDVSDILGPRGKSSEEDVIAFLKKNKMSDDLMASVIGFYGIDGEEYFDDNENWKDTSKKEKSSIENIVNDSDIKTIKNDMGELISLFKKNGLTAEDAINVVLFNSGFGIIDKDLKNKYLKFGKKAAFDLDSKIGKVYKHLVDDNNLEHKDVKDYLINALKNSDEKSIKKIEPKKKFADKKTFSEDKPFIKHRQDKNFTLVVKNKNNNFSINVGPTIGGDKWRTHYSGEAISNNKADIMKIINSYFPNTVKETSEGGLFGNISDENPDKTKIEKMYNELDTYLDELRSKVKK